MCYVECKKDTTVEHVRHTIGEIVVLMKKDYMRIELINGRVYFVFINEEGKETGVPLPKEQWDIKKGI